MCSKSMQTFYPFLVVMVLVWISVVRGARGNNLTDAEIEEHLKRLNKPAIKTIMSDDGDIIDCVDIYKQPAFDHPLLKNHTIDMKPSFIPKSPGVQQVRQAWPKSVACPKGTIPIRRIQKADLLRTGNSGNFSVKALFEDCKVEVARVELHRGGPYLRAEGTITVWDLYVEPWEWSLNSVTVFNVFDSFIETGWAVSPILFGDSRPRVFINWLLLTQDTQNNRGCFNLACPGFVQTSNSYTLGAPIYPTSVFNSTQYTVRCTIYNDAVQQKWWVTFNSEPIGYWPWSILRHFDLVPRINWGGSVCNTQARGVHTNTQMGNGHFPIDVGSQTSGHIRLLAVATPFRSDFIDALTLEYSAPAPTCYHVTPGPRLGQGFNYGGPGGPHCDQWGRK